MTVASPSEDSGTKIIVAEAGWLATHGLPADAGSGTAWYFGNDHELYQRLRSSLAGPIEWGDTGKRMSETAARHEDAFVNLEQGFHINDTVWWDCRDLAERGP